MIPDPLDGMPLNIRGRGRPRKPPEPTQAKYICKGCGRDNLIRADFYIHSGSGYRYSRCKECVKARTRARRKGVVAVPKLTAGISYKQALPPEQWGAMEHFLRSLLYCADVAAQGGIKPDVGAFMTAYKGGLE